MTGDLPAPSAPTAQTAPSAEAAATAAAARSSNEKDPRCLYDQWWRDGTEVDHPTRQQLQGERERLALVGQTATCSYRV